MSFEIARSATTALHWLSTGALALLGLACAGPPGTGAPRFTSKRAVRSGTVRVRLPVDDAFQLFTPLGERSWAPDWDPRILFPSGGILERDLVFTVTHGHGGEAVWIVDACDPASHTIEYLYVLPERTTCRIRVQCEAQEPRQTRASVTYTMTGLSEDGNRIVDELSAVAFAHRMRQWEEQIAGRAAGPVRAAGR